MYVVNTFTSKLDLIASFIRSIIISHNRKKTCIHSVVCLAQCWIKPGDIFPGSVERRCMRSGNLGRRNWHRLRILIHHVDADMTHTSGTRDGVHFQFLASHKPPPFRSSVIDPRRCIGSVSADFLLAMFPYRCSFCGARVGDRSLLSWYRRADVHWSCVGFYRLRIGFYRLTCRSGSGHLTLNVSMILNHPSASSSLHIYMGVATRVAGGGEGMGERVPRFGFWGTSPRNRNF